jgi:multiple sugar transport system permease protein
MTTLIKDLAAPVDKPPRELTPRPRRGRTRGGFDSQRASAFTYIGVIVFVALLGVPFIWIVLTALASQEQLSEGAAGLIALDPVWDNFVQAVTRVDFLKFGLNSLILSTITAVLTTFVSSMVGFGFARLRGRGRNAVFSVLVASMMIPAIATLIPTYVLFARLHLVGTFWPWVLWGLAGTPYLIFLFRQFFTAIPLELEDAAIVDGVGWWRMFLLIFFPLARPVLLTSLLLSFTWTWGDYLAPALLLNGSNTTLAVAMASGYLDPRGNGIITLQAAGSLLYILPVIVIFLFAQKYFIGSALGSGVKG